MNYSTIKHRDAVGKWGEMIAEYIFGYRKADIFLDKNGIDGFWAKERTIQIKTDLKIIETGNIYKEVYEKTYPIDNWRISPCNASIHIFITNKYCYLIADIEISKKCKELSLIQINETSKGYLIPITSIPHTKKEHGFYYPENPC